MFLDLKLTINDFVHADRRIWAGRRIAVAFFKSSDK